MNAHLSSLLDKEVSRKEFLTMSGLAVVSMLGFGSIVKMLTGRSLAGHPQLQQQTATYGIGAYGGFKR